MLKQIFYFATILLLVSCNSPKPEEQKNLSSDKKFKTEISKKFKDILKNSSKVTIAVMPISNKEVSKDIVDYFRKDIMDKLEYKGYSIIDPKVLDSALLKLGKENPLKIKTIDKKELKALTSADFILYSNLKSDSREGKIFYSGSLVLQDLDKNTMWSCYSNLDIEKKEGIDPLSLAVDTLLTGGGAALGIIFDISKADTEIKKGVKFFTDSLLSSLPDGPIDVGLGGGLLDSAIEVK